MTDLHPIQAGRARMRKARRQAVVVMFATTALLFGMVAIGLVATLVRLG